MNSAPVKFSDIAAKHSVAVRTHEQRQKSAKGRANRLRAQAAALTKRADKIELRRDAAEFPHFIDGVIRPIANAVLELMPGHEFEILGPFGLSCEVSVYFTKKGLSKEERMQGSNFRALYFVSAGTEEVVKLRDFSTNTGKFPEGSIGSMNGMNHPSVTIPGDADARWFLKWMRKQARATGKRG